MRDIKEKINKPREKPRRLKERGGSIKRAVGGQIGKLMKDRYRMEQAKSKQGREPDAVVSAEEQVEQYTGQSFTTIADSASRGMDRARRTVKGRRTAKPDAAMPEQPENPRTPTPGERMKQAAIKEKKEQVIKGKGGVCSETPPFSASIAPDANTITPTDPSPVYHPPAGKAAAYKTPGRASQATAEPIGRQRPLTKLKERPRSNAPAIKAKQAVSIKQRTATQATGKAGTSVKATAQATGKAGASTKVTAKTIGKSAARKAAGQAAQTQARQLAINRAKKAAQTAANLARKAAQAVVHAVASLISAVVGAVGAVVLIPALCIVFLVAAVVSSPFGIIFADQQKEPDAISVNAAVAQINVEYADKLTQLQEGDYDSIQINGQPPDWREVIAVFACKTAAAEDGVDVVTLDPDRVERLRTVFWDMTAITTEVDTVESEDGDTTTLTIIVTAKTADEMRTVYNFTDYQNEALDALLEEMEMLGGLLGDLSITQEDAVALLENLPEDLSPQRKAVIQHALTLVGKVNYFWGGKSLTLGWDTRWGTTMKVTAPGSSSSGTYRPYGLDCSGFVDWVFYNASGGEYIIGHGGGAASQHTYCAAISWGEAQPGDLVFYPEDSHVGIVGGKDENGNLLIIHCASGANNVVITGASGFTAIGRPYYFNE